VIASPDQELNAAIQAAFSGPSFRVYTNTDQLGVELAASLKNIVAIGAGVCQRLELGNNTIAALITRGLAEITRLAVAMGARPATLAGLAGLGDLGPTCTGELSRNRRTGIELARGRRIEEITAATRMVAEGVPTTYAAMDLSRKWGIDLPITRQVWAILRAEKPPREAVRDLMDLVGPS
jgi:glycerol-3-phosphate dehydrogenase (NAD(P)+)